MGGLGWVGRIGWRDGIEWDGMGVVYDGAGRDGIGREGWDVM